MPANCAEISKMTSGGGNWILRDLGPPEAKAFNRKYSSCIRLWNTAMKNKFRHHLENFISFPLIYRFASIRRVLTDLEADNWKHRSNKRSNLNLWTIVLGWRTVDLPILENYILFSAKSSIYSCKVSCNIPTAEHYKKVLISCFLVECFCYWKYRKKESFLNAWWLAFTEH